MPSRFDLIHALIATCFLYMSLNVMDTNMILYLEEKNALEIFSFEFYSSQLPGKLLQFFDNLLVYFCSSK